ncbi:hypothetical protein K438DRAFT_1960644 [Mycena galopus ATCC 62051]|nr:hypothetical protein K438DRAFT_1960644 [Mycena galopus ATCC 62051]
MEDDPVFPQELFDVILDHLADDLEALRSCALVSSSFYRRAHLFARLQIGPLDGKEHTVAKLYELLKSSPSFAASVESIHLSDKRGPNRSGWIVGPCKEPRSTFESPAGQLISLLVSLTCVCVTIDERAGGTWFSLPMLKSIELALAQGNLASLELTRMAILFELLSHCPGLRSLTLRWCSFEDFDSAVAASAGSPPTRLEHLSLNVRTSFLDQLVDWILLPKSPVVLSSFRSLECIIDSPNDHPLIQRLLSASAQSLERLSLTQYECFTQAGMLDLHELTHLRTLSLDTWLHVGQAAAEEDQRLLVLGNFVFPPLQKALALVFDLGTKASRPEFVRKLAAADRALAALPFLTSVAIQFTIWEPLDDKKEKLVNVSDEFVREMPLLASQLPPGGVLRILETM